MGLRFWTKTRRWADLEQVTLDLDGVAEVRLPRDLHYDPEATRRSGDYAGFVFSRVDGHHLNGMTSYAENLEIYFAAPDLAESAFDSLAARGTFDNFRRATAIRTERHGPIQLDLFSGTYDRDPVHEPTWSIRLTHRAARIAVSWWGYQKTYTLDQARENLQHLHAQIKPSGTIAAFLQRSRTYDSAAWQAVRDRNLAALNDALRDLGLPPVQTGAWTHHGGLRYLIDNNRPQQFHLVQPIAHTRLPDGPFKLLGPLTAFRFIQNTWWQDNQGLGGGQVPYDNLAELTREMTDHAEVYLYRIHSFNLWRPFDGAPRDLLRQALAEGDAMKGQFQAGKLLGGDAEP